MQKWYTKSKQYFESEYCFVNEQMNNGKVDIIIRESDLTTQYKTLVSKILRHPCLERL